MATQMARFVPPEFIGAGPKRPDPRRTALQDEAVASAVAGYSAGAQRGQIIEPCGVGKTLIAIRIVAALGARTVLVLVPRLDLVSQWGREFYSWYGRPFDPAIFCSDDDIADGASFPRWTTRTTSTAELRGFMASGDPAVTKIVFATYQSSGNLAGSAFDIGVVDEAHNCVGDMSGLFKTVLDDEKIRIARRLFITATQKVVRLRGDTPDDVTWASMDDVVAFGPVFHRTTFGEGIKRGLVNDYEVAIFDVAERQLNRYASEMGIVAEDALKQAGAVLGTLNALRRHKKKRLVAFLNSVQGAKDFAQALTEARLHLGSAHRPPGRFWSGCIHAGTPHAARQQMLAAFDGDDSFVRVISNVDVLGEGVDMQGADAVAIIEPRMSTINIVQALSRGLRVKPRKGKTLFLLSVMRRDGQDASALLDESSFRHVWRVLLAMAEMDERLRGELERFAFKASKEGKAAATAALPARIHLDGDIVGMHVAIRTQIVKRVGFSVGVARPDLMREFHPTKNGALTAFDLTPGMQKKVWWLGVKGGPGRCRHQHEWQAAPASRVAGCGCPFCSGNRVDRNMSVGALNPDLAREFHPTKNGALTAFDVTPGMQKKVWWLGVKGGPGRCKRRHEWQTRVGDRVRGHGCPFCSGLRVERATSVGALNPDLAREFHPTKNGALTAFDISPGTQKKVWWLGVKDGPGRCKHRHEWLAVVASRTKGSGCPFCSGNRVERAVSVGVLHPDLAKELHPAKNGALTAFDFNPNSARKIWWLGVKGGLGRCERRHEWQATAQHRVHHGARCPFCFGPGLRVERATSVGALNPDLAREFHPTKNGALTAFDVNPGTLKKVWWLGVKDGPGRCKHRHEWQAAVGNRTKGSGCPFCSGNRVERSTSVGGLNPDLAREWHPTKNGALTAFDISPGSGRKVWWRGVKGAPGRCARRHEWQAVVASRTRGMGCPQCKRDRASKRPA